MLRRCSYVLLVVATASCSQSSASSSPPADPVKAAVPTPGVAAARGPAAPTAQPAPRPLAPGMHRYTVKSLGITVDLPSAKIAEEVWDESDMGTPAVHLRARDSGFEVYLSSAVKDRYDMAARAKLEQSYQQGVGGITSLRQEATKDGGWEFEFRDIGNADFGFHARIVLDGKPFNCAMASENRKQLDELIDVCHSMALAH
jgi:hypothetical protein